MPLANKRHAKLIAAHLGALVALHRKERSGSDGVLWLGETALAPGSLSLQSLAGGLGLGWWPRPEALRWLDAQGLSPSKIETSASDAMDVVVVTADGTSIKRLSARD